MTTTPASEHDPELALAVLQGDGFHTATTLSKYVRTGRALRVRRGVYIRPEHWITAMPWARYRIAVAATALATDPIFCRETALLLHGVPLISIPASVRARTLRSGGTGRVAAPALTGQLPIKQFRQLYQRQHPGGGEISAHRLRNIPTQLLRPARERGISRPAMTNGLHQGLLPLHEISLTPSTAMWVRGPERYRVEPLELALLDTVSQMPFAEAVVALDWAKAQGGLDLEPWLKYLSTGRMQRRWERAWEFSTGQSESPGESRSRALIEELGFAAPTLQAVISTDRGTFRTDFCWERDRVLGEFDGRVKYYDDAALDGRDPTDVLFQEKQREDALRREGWTVVRWTWDDLNHPTRLAAFLKQAGVRLRR